MERPGPQGTAEQGHLQSAPRPQERTGQSSGANRAPGGQGSHQPMLSPGPAETWPRSRPSRETSQAQTLHMTSAGFPNTDPEGVWAGLLFGEF